MRLKFHGERFELLGNSRANATQDSALAQAAEDRAAILATLQDLIRDAKSTKAPPVVDVDAIHGASLAELNKLHAEFYGGKR